MLGLVGCHLESLILILEFLHGLVFLLELKSYCGIELLQLGETSRHGGEQVAVEVTSSASRPLGAALTLEEGGGLTRLTWRTFLDAWGVAAEVRLAYLLTEVWGSADTAGHGWQV